MGTTKKTEKNQEKTINSEAVVENTLLSPSSFRSTTPLIVIRYLSMSIGAIIAILFVVQHFQMIQFPEKMHLSLPQQVSTILHKVTNKPAPITEKSHSSLEAQIQYAKAINWLNEGKEELARNELKSILDKYPNFKPAKESYTTLIKNEMEK